MPPKDEILIKVGNNIRKWRHIIGFKQEQLADMLEISTVSMSKIETGRTDIPLKRLFSIAEALGVTIELLFLDPFSGIRNNQNNHMTSWSSSNNVFLNSTSGSIKTQLTDQ